MGDWSGGPRVEGRALYQRQEYFTELDQKISLVLK